MDNDNNDDLVVINQDEYEEGDRRNEFMMTALYSIFMKRPFVEFQRQVNYCTIM